MNSSILEIVPAEISFSAVFLQK